MFQLSNDEWLIIEDGYRKDEINWREGIFSLSNGSMGVRGSLEEMPEGSQPGVYLGGVFDRGDSWTWDMINNTSFLKVEIIADGHRFGIDSSETLEHKRVLDMRQGLLSRSTVLKSPDGLIISWQSYRIVSKAEPYLCAEKHIITPVNFSGEIAVNSVLDANVYTYDTFLINKVKHYELADIDHMDNSLFAVCRLVSPTLSTILSSRCVKYIYRLPSYME